jgi:hypothetical protein
VTISFPLELPPGGTEERIARADLTFAGLDHSGASFVARVYFDNPGATADTPTDAGSGYVARFAIFGHGDCYGEDGHCEVTPAISAFDRSHPHQLEPATRIVTVTDAVKARMAAGAGSVQVTVVPVVRTSAVADASAAENVLVIDQVALHTYE